MKINTIHIYTDYTFIQNSDRFKGNLFENTVIIITEEIKNHVSQKQIIQIKNSQKALQEVIKICKQAKLVVLYDLDSIKIKIALSLPQHIKIAWRFFGHELYDKRRHLYLSGKTKRALGIRNLLSYLNCFRGKKYFKRIVANTSQKLHYSLSSSFLDAIKRIDFFLGLSKKEYEYLLEFYPQLPKFIQHPIIAVGTNTKLPEFKLNQNPNSYLTIIGNSKGIYNNHLDIIDLIEGNSNKHKYNFTLLFNYGLEKNYTKKVRKLTRGKSYFHLIEEFMPIEEFNNLYEEARALVINSYRQMAMGNIFTAFKKGVKVYLNEKNLIVHWLKEEGFKVYSIKDFQHDLQDNNLSLNEDSALHNFLQLKKLSEKYSTEKFQKLLYTECVTNTREQ